MDGNEFADILVNKNRREFFIPDGEESFYKQCADKLRQLSSLVATQCIEIHSLKGSLAEANQYAWPEITNPNELQIGAFYYLQDRTTGESIISMYCGNVFHEETKGFPRFGAFNKSSDQITKTYKILPIAKPPK